MTAKNGGRGVGGRGGAMAQWFRDLLAGSQLLTGLPTDSFLAKGANLADDRTAELSASRIQSPEFRHEALLCQRQPTQEEQQPESP